MNYKDIALWAIYFGNIVILKYHDHDIIGRNFVFEVHTDEVYTFERGLESLEPLEHHASSHVSNANPRSKRSPNHREMRLIV